MTWADSQLIHNQRVMVAITGGARGPAAHSNLHGDGKGTKQELVCRAFNSRGGCKHRAQHDEGQVRLLHICAFCDSIGRHCTGHNVIGCNSKTQYPGPPPRSSYGYTQSHPHMATQQRQALADLGNWRQQPPPSIQQPQYQQFAKNAM